jgi:cytochrome c oxidase cbb3-type subunit 3
MRSPGPIVGALLLCALSATPVIATPAADTLADNPAATETAPAAVSAAELAAAARAARPAFARHCSACHGANGQGRRDLGAPNLVDAVWVWDDATADSPVAALEDTIRYGIRSGHPHARNTAVMPAYGHGGEIGLDPAQIADVVLYVSSLSGQAVDPAARRRGRAIYAGRANCIECHSGDGTGNADWGAPDLTVANDGAWLYGRDSASLTTTISQGRAGHCPAWIDRIDAPTIHALALWLRSGHADPAP